MHKEKKKKTQSCSDCVCMLYQVGQACGESVLRRHNDKRGQSTEDWPERQQGNCCGGARCAYKVWLEKPLLRLLLGIREII